MNYLLVRHNYCAAERIIHFYFIYLIYINPVHSVWPHFAPPRIPIGSRPNLFFLEKSKLTCDTVLQVKLKSKGWNEEGEIHLKGQ